MHLVKISTSSTASSSKSTKSRLEDSQDVAYSVVVDIAGLSVPLILDTGSADLWLLSSPSSATLHPSTLSVNFTYGGTSNDGTFASGDISRTDSIKVAGVDIANQYIASIIETNATVIDVGASGILGLGFPANSVIWNTLASVSLPHTPPEPAQAHSQNTSKQMSNTNSNTKFATSFSDLASFSAPRLHTPNPSFLVNKLSSSPASDDNPSITPTDEYSNALLASLITYGPPLVRLVNPALPPGDVPAFSLNLMRRDIFADFPSSSLSYAIGGEFIIGTLNSLTSSFQNASPPPFSESNPTTTYHAVRLYTPSQNGLFVPSEPEEVYPYAWEVFVDSVWFDGVLVQDRVWGGSGEVLEGVGEGDGTGEENMDRDGDFGLSVLIDSGNTLIRGPEPIIRSIYAMLNSTVTRMPGGGNSEDPPTYPCTIPHNLSFVMGGTRYDVDPRDFGTPISSFRPADSSRANVSHGGDDGGQEIMCIPNLAIEDPPRIGGWLYSWSLGTPFLHSVHATFAYGNITHPSSSSPLIALRSVVPDDAVLRMRVGLGLLGLGLDIDATDDTFIPVTTSATSRSPNPAQTEAWCTALLGFVMIMSLVMHGWF
ncbi:hypothetical protein BD410DRAFT_789755 [Rickenella mellea]|uniref:Peptidase A1 domain-containing protein n=1 Tax=Rickenella mellea TaxID=50990 RepID=A0A4Y7Q210_9AGAM|nr:hypothetical protein BD410DRAFT_789755 [Rickenella mellea]